MQVYNVNESGINFIQHYCFVLSCCENIRMEVTIFLYKVCSLRQLKVENDLLTQDNIYNI